MARQISYDHNLNRWNLVQRVQNPNRDIPGCGGKWVWEVITRFDYKPPTDAKYFAKVDGSTTCYKDADCGVIKALFEWFPGQHEWKIAGYHPWSDLNEIGVNRT